MRLVNVEFIENGFEVKKLGNMDTSLKYFLFEMGGLILPLIR